MEQAVKVSEYFAALKEQILERVDLSREVPDEEMQDLIDEVVLSCGREQHLTLNEKCRLKKELFHALRKMDVLQELLEEQSVTEIMVNGIYGIFVERHGKLEKLGIQFDSAEKLKHVIRQITSECNRVVNESSPIVDARLKDGARVNVVLDPVALNGPILTIRRFPQNPVTVEQLLSFGSLTEECRDWLKEQVRAGCNILVSGGTGSGKTTFLNVLSQFIPKEERVITIEDSAGLQIGGIANLVSLETRNANVEGCKEITIRDLIKASLRMRPDRIIVGEVRGKEAVDMLQSVNVGHSAMTTVHANSVRDVVSRLETMVLMGMEMPISAIRKQVAAGFHYMIHLGRLKDGSRRVLEIAKPDGIVDGEVQMHTVFCFEQTGIGEDGKILGGLRRIGEG